MTLDEICEWHCRAGIRTWTEYGALLPKVWADGPKRRAIAEPAGPDGLEINAATLVVLMTRVALLADARFLGRSAEAWARTLEPGDEIPETGDLDRDAEIDPRIRTSIVSEGIDLEAVEVAATAGYLGLSDSGHPQWTIEPAGMIGTSFLQIMLAAHNLLDQGWRVDDDVDEMLAWIEDREWRVQIFDA